MNKKILMILLMMMLVMLSGCKLVKDETSNIEKEELEFEQDYLVGMFIYFKDRSFSNFFPTNNFADHEALYIYEKVFNHENQEYAEFKKSDIFTDINVSITNGGNIMYGKLDIEASFYYTYELLESILYIQGIYMRDDYSVYSQVFENTPGIVLDNMGSQKQAIKQEMSIQDGDETITYSANISLNVKMIDYLLKATVVELDKDYNVIKREDINYSGTSNIDYKVSSECMFLIIEKEYEVKNNSQDSTKRKGDKYYTYELCDVNNDIANLYFPRSDGFVNKVGVNFDFSKEDVVVKARDLLYNIITG